MWIQYNKTCLKWLIAKRPKIGFQEQLLCPKYCRMLHSATLSTFIKLLFVINIFVLVHFWVAAKDRLYYTFTSCIAAIAAWYKPTSTVKPV